MEDNVALGRYWVPAEKITLIEAHTDANGVVTHCLVTYAGEEHTLYGHVARGFVEYVGRRAVSPCSGR